MIHLMRNHSRNLSLTSSKTYFFNFYMISQKSKIMFFFFFFSAADKLIVCQSQLMSLFTICPACCGETQGSVEKQEGTFVKIKQVRTYLCFLVENEVVP